MEEQQSSFATQIKYYTEKISSHPKWQLVNIFADEGISGTTDKKRPAFMKMLGLCEAGKIDLVLTKSISRFSRNTVDCLSWVRKLKTHGVSVIFEKEGINTGETIGEPFLTWFSAFAQAESESISQNVTWGKRKGFKEGRCGFPYHQFCGYEKGVDGNPVIIEEEAIIIRRIYESYLEGMSRCGIKEWLESEKIPSPAGNKNWTSTSIHRILTNEKYCGDVLCQKKYTADFITKDVRKNNGELPQYLIEDHHPAIVSKETFQRVQEEIKRRASIYKPKEKKGKYSSKYALTGKAFCSECGAPYQRVTWNVRGEKKIVWRCSNRLENGSKVCKHSPSVPEEELKKYVLDHIKSKLSVKKPAEEIKMCLKKLEAEILKVLDELVVSQEERMEACFDTLIRQTIQKIIISKDNISIDYINGD